MRTIRNSSVCVVGGAGFLGSHCVNHLVNDRDCQVLVIDNLCAGRREFVHHKAIFHHADITHSEEHLFQLFHKYQVKYVLNYAAYPYIPDSFERPLHVFEVNANGALKVINAAERAGVVGILQISSAEIYGDFLRPPHGAGKDRNWKITEQCPVNPHSTYGTSKVAIDNMIQVRWREAKTPCIVLRQFNCLGSRETHPYIVPEIISQLSQIENQWNKACWMFDPKTTEEAVVRLGNNSTRDFMYAGDQGIMAVELLENGWFGQVYNLGSEQSIKMYDLAKLIGKLMGFQNVNVEEDETRKRPWEIWHLCSDNSKIYSLIQARPTVSLEEALKRTITYYLENGSKWCWE